MSRVITVTAIGDQGVGKSQLLLNFAQQPFGTYQRFDTYERDLTVYGQTVKVRANDSCNQSDKSKSSRAAYSGTNTFLLCAAVDKPESLESLVKKWHEDLRASNSANLPLILVLTKCDLQQNSDVKSLKLDSEEVAQIAQKLRVTDAFECSAKTGHNVEAAFRRAAELAIRTQMDKKKGCEML
ncbi:unnamed protein product [Calicophoron daubneyi]|uniref:Uncharacterized protein n=1 Tax=Calicophoron daubneyi TaxID=300641 RepID=A0AAV2SZY2_CALDB